MCREYTVHTFRFCFFLGPKVSGINPPFFSWPVYGPHETSDVYSITIQSRKRKSQIGYIDNISFFIKQLFKEP